jgi:uncharacterized lipoprotein YmbA
MKAFLIIFLLSIMSLTACSSNNKPKTQYYLLNSPMKLITQDQQKKNSSLNLVDEKKLPISVKILELPDYLAQPSLVLQLSDHQLHYSHFNMWAEPLREGIAQALTRDLNASNKQFNFTANSATSDNKKASITIKITTFQATHQSQVLLMGSYTLLNNELTNKLAMGKNRFKLFVALDSDGYPHAVEKMRQAITLLAKEISMNMSKQ